MATSHHPSIQLPQDPSSLHKYLHAQQLSHLRALFETKSISVAAQLEDAAAARRGRRGRQRRRRNSSPGPSPLDDDAEEEEELAQRKKLKYSNEESAPIDSGHAYELEYDLAPNGSSDTYYHGPHPPPPAKVVRAIVRASKLPPLFDPIGLSAVQLEGVAKELWKNEGRRAPGMMLEPEEVREPGASRTLERELQAEAEDEWESSVIAAFSNGCDARIAKSVAALPPSQRPQQQYPEPMRPPSPFQEAERYAPPAGYWQRCTEEDKEEDVSKGKETPV